MATGFYHRGGSPDATGNYYPDWLRLIHEANRIAPALFGEPVRLAKDPYLGELEYYADAIVRHGIDGDTRVVAITEHGATVLQQAADTLGYVWRPNPLLED